MHHLRPSFFIIGERKCATSAVYRYLIEHPQVLPCAVKEPQFFSRSWLSRKIYWHQYLKLFPKANAEGAEIAWFDLLDDQTVRSRRLGSTRDPGLPVITGEASANTFAQVPPQRLHRAFPKAHLILCLRHPVDRACAHYRMLERFAAEGRKLPLKLTTFSHDFEQDVARVLQGGGGYFAGPSFYSRNLANWLRVFDKDQISLIRTEDLKIPDVASGILQEICAHLGIASFDFSRVMQEAVNVSHGPALDPVVRQQLMQYFIEDIRRLEDLAGRMFDWTT